MGKDYVLDEMKVQGLPMTREQYLDIAYIGSPPEHLSAEQEAELPEEFQREEDEPNAGVTPPEDEEEEMRPFTDCVTRALIQHGIPLTQRNWIELAYLGQKSFIEELEGEELADPPDGFEDWPEEEQPVN